MGDRVVDCARLESVCAERHRGFESPPIRHTLKLASLRLKVKVKLKALAGWRRIAPDSSPVGPLLFLRRLLCAFSDFGAKIARLRIRANIVASAYATGNSS